jgi:predicted ATPase
MPLAELLHEKTEGNPFFAIQFLTNLAEEHLLEFDAREAAWRWSGWMLAFSLYARRCTSSIEAIRTALATHRTSLSSVLT